jgi:hypothetical protein
MRYPSTSSQRAAQRMNGNRNALVRTIQSTGRSVQIGNKLVKQVSAKIQPLA